MNTLDTLTEYLLQHARTVTCAESCTGGLLAAEAANAMAGALLLLARTWKGQMLVGQT